KVIGKVIHRNRGQVFSCGAARKMQRKVGNRAMQEGTATGVERVETGHGVIAGYLRTLDNSPGVYRMLDAESRVLYVGKARSLKKRVANYAKSTGHSGRIARMIRETASMMFLTTRTEVEA